MDIDRAIEDVARLMAVDGVEQLVAGQDATVGGEDRREELELDRCEVDSGLAAADLMACRVDDEIGMADDRSSSTVRSRCRWLGPAQDRLDPKDQLRPGMFVNVTFTIDLGERNALPMSAIIPQSDPPACWRVVAGKAVRTPLKLGVRDGQNVEVLQMQKGTTWEAVTGSEEVVLTGLGAVSDGKEVNVQKK